LFLLRGRQVPAVGFNVGVFLRFDSAIISTELLRLLRGERAVLARAIAPNRAASTSR
jgi:hypothetical protein